MSALDNVKLHLVETFEEACALKEWASHQEALAVDTEGTGYHPDSDHTRMVQFGNTEEGWALSVETRGWGALCHEILTNHQGPIVAHNAKFDAAMIRKDLQYSFPLHRTHDTMIMHHVLNPHLRSGLKAVSDRLIDPDASAGQDMLKKDFADFKWDWSTVPTNHPTYHQYAALDTVITARLHDILLPQVQKEAPKAYDLEMATAWLTEKVERRGAMTDRPYAEENLAVFQQRSDDISAQIKAEYGIEPGSSKGIIGVLQNAGHNFTKRTKGGAISLDKEVLSAIDHPLVTLIGQYRTYEKLSSTYLENFLKLTSDGHPFLHPSINSLGFNEAGSGYGVKTSRMSMSDPNLQNLPKANKKNPDAPAQIIRNCIVARPDHTLIFCDFSQIEMRLLAHYSKDQHLIDAFKHGDFFVNLAQTMFQDTTIQADDYRRQILKHCVPTTSEILTKRGWLTHTDVRVGDETLGINTETGTSEWTPVLAVHEYPEAEVMRFGNTNRSFLCTSEHEWLTISRHGTTKKKTAKSICGTEWSVQLAVPYAGTESILTDREAAILGWLLTDGHIKRAVVTGRTSQAKLSKVACEATIYQVKSHTRAIIEQLLTNIPHYVYTGQYRLVPTYARELLSKSGVWDKNTYDPWMLVTSLNSSARASMLEAVTQADGFIHYSAPTVYEATGSKAAELVRALMYLSGKHPGTTVREPNGKGWQKNPIDVVRSCASTMTGQKATLTPHSIGPVWCVTTALGTWTMRQGVTPVMTGNSMYAQIYGAGIEKFAATSQTSIKDAHAFVSMLHDSFPGMRQFNQDTTTEAFANKRRYGDVPFVRSDITNRRYIVDAGKEYALVNRRLQGAAAEIFKMKILELEACDLDRYMILFVHDEVILDVPNEDVRDVVHVLQQVMNDDKLLRVPITAEISYGQRWGQKHSWTDET